MLFNYVAFSPLLRLACSCGVFITLYLVSFILLSTMHTGSIVGDLSTLNFIMFIISIRSITASRPSPTRFFIVRRFY